MFSIGKWTTNGLALFLFLAIARTQGAPQSAESDLVSFDFRDYTLTVVSPHPTATPAVGTHIYAWRSTVECSLVDTSATHTPVGWTGTGSVPAEGTALTTGPLVLDEAAGETASTIIWNWRVDFPTVTFDLGEHGTHIGGGALVQQVAQGGSAVAPDIEVAAGWLFTGWSADFTAVTDDLLVTALYEPVTYALTVLSGAGDGEYAAGTVVPIVADAPPAGQTFADWLVDPPEFAANLAAPSAASTTFAMPTQPATLTATYVASGSRWSIPFTLASATPGTLLLGMHENATDGPDSGLDVVLPAPGQAYLASDNLAVAYSTDLRAPAESAEFLLVADATDGAVTVSWNLAALPAGKFLSLYEVLLTGGDAGRTPASRTLIGNTALNLATAESLVIPAGETRSYVIHYGDELAFDLAFSTGWNLISLPIAPLDSAVEAVLHDSSRQGTIHEGDVLFWDGNDYAISTDMHACLGYWVYANQAVVLLVKGPPAEQDALPLSQGWNLLGSTTVRLVPADERIRGPVWRWNAGTMRYEPTELLLPGWGHWINAAVNAEIPFPQEDR